MALIHGHYYEPEFLAWKNMKKRCSDFRWQQWYRNISVCDRWLESYTNFLEDVGRRPSPQHSLDRIDGAKDYAPSNVRWATRSIQAQNTKLYNTSRSGVKGVSWSTEKNKWRATIYVNNVQKFIGYFWDIEDAANARKTAEVKLWQKAT